MPAIESSSHSAAEALLGAAERYLAALSARDARRLALAPAVRFTENAQALPVGAALWRTAGGPVRYRNLAADPQTGQVGGFAVLGENDHQVILGLRLRVAAGLIHELETIVVRGPAEWISPESLAAPRPAFLERVSSSDRASRDQLIATANLYFEGLERADGDLIPFDSRVVRIENGLRTTNNPGLDRKTVYPSELLKLGPAEQINTQFFSYIQKVRDRRFPVVDVDRGLVLALAVFDHPGDLEYAVGPDGSRVMMPPEARRPSSALLGYLFKIEGGRIREVETAYLMLPYGAPCGWSAGE